MRSRSPTEWPRLVDAARPLLWCGIAAIALVIVRSFPMVAYERLDFDSDQAIVGLMAKHLSELRTFPLFFYGQDYMLGVQSWIAAPFIRLGGPTVAMLRMPLVIINTIVAVWLIREIARTVRSPWLAFVAVLPFASASAVLSANLLETLGASVEPFLYMLLLWALRRRPAIFGLVLAVGFLHREFTIFAVAAIGVASHRETGRSCLADWHWVSRAALGFAAVWLAVDQLKARLGTMGPGGPAATASLTMQMETLISRLALAPSAVLPKLRQAVTEVLPDLLGMRAIQPLRYNINTTMTVGSTVVGVALAAAGTICLVRLAGSQRNRRQPHVVQPPSAFCIYLAVIGVQGFLAYSLSDAVDPHFPAILRYALLGLFLPIALFTAFFETERSRALLTGVALLLVLTAVLNTRDSWRIIDEYRRTPTPSEHRILADDLVAHHIQYGTATYFDAYITDFLSGERVILHSSDKVRIAAYETLVTRHLSSSVRILRQPCNAGRPVASSWCLVDSLNR